MIGIIMVRKWLDPLTGEVWADEAIPQPAPPGVTVLHDLQYAKNVKCAPHGLAMRAIASGCWMKVGEFDDGIVPVNERSWSQKDAVIKEQPGSGPALKPRPATAAPMRTVRTSGSRPAPAAGSAL